MLQIFEYTALMTCFCIIVLKGTTGKPSEPVALYLHTEARTWNEANHKCLKEDSRLVTLKDMVKVRALQAVVKEWKKLNLINDDLWMGMFYTENGQYNWTDCTPLGSWALWFLGEPNFQTKHRCIRVDHSDLSWKTINCDRSYQFICEKRLEKCWYDTFTHKSLTGSLVNAGFTNLTGCENLCLTSHTPFMECVALTFTASNECLILMEGKSFLDSEPFPQMEFKLASVSAIKRCFFFDHSSTHSVPTFTDTNQYPNFTCSATSHPIKTSTSPTPVTSTTTSSPFSTTDCSCDCHPLTTTAELTALPSADVLTELSPSKNHSTPTNVSGLVSNSQTDNASSVDNSSTVVGVLENDTSISRILENDSSISGILENDSSIPVILENESSVSEMTVSPTMEISPSPSVLSSTLLHSDLPAMSWSCASWVDLQTSMTEPTALATSTMYSTDYSSTVVEETTSATDGTTSYTDGLVLNRTSLSSYRRKMTSAEDSRTSAVVIGSIGCGNIALFFVVILILDGTNIIQLIQHIINSWFK